MNVISDLDLLREKHTNNYLIFLMSVYTTAHGDHVHP